MTAPQTPSKPPAKPAQPGRPAPGPGPKPSGPTHPKPTAPKSDQPAGALVYDLPPLRQIVADARTFGGFMVASLSCNFDPTTAPDDEAYPGMSEVDVRLAKATSYVRGALRELAVLDALVSAVMFPARQDARTAHSVLGGPSDHPDPMSGEGRSPGYAAASGSAASESDGTAIPAQATSYPVAPGEGRAPGLVEAVAPRGGEGGSLGEPQSPEAGASSDPRPALATGARTAHDVAGPPGVGAAMSPAETAYWTGDAGGEVLFGSSPPVASSVRWSAGRWSR